ncbi:venom protease isoform X2 [Halyomorpha halys]|uniref:venom protease isoform X2 n=1 Tax=Halyomorpha halys TaxID=286706 RepID=UPI0006D50FEE|nr:venom protease-like isoform X2 [Halyomorpha halys]
MVGYETDSAVSSNMFVVLACAFFFVSPTASQLLDLNEGAPCEALGEESGTCQLLTECYNPGDFKKEHPPICTFQGKIPVICCPDSTGIKEEDFRFKFGSNKAGQYCKNQTASCEKHKQNVADFVMEGNTAKSFANNFLAIIGYGHPPNQVWKCSGTIITSKFILSAASCAELKGFGPATWARLGGLQISPDNNVNEWVNQQIADRIPHPDYKEGALYNDIALFQISKEVPFSLWMSPICLHNGRLVKGEVTASFWGESQTNPDSPDLMESRMTIDDHQKCQSMTPESRSFPRGVKEPLMFCASVEDYNPNYCPTETAGGPILVRQEGECLATQIGIASYRKQSCGETNFPTVYTRVSQYLPWIEAIVFHVINL